MYLWNFLLILILVLLNGFFTAVEFAVVTSRKSRIEVMTDSDNSSAQIVKRWLESPEARDKLIAAAQLGVTIVSLALGAIGENTFESILEPVFDNLQLGASMQWAGTIVAALPLFISLVIITSLHVVLGEQVPKVAALNRPESIALFGAQPMNLFAKIFRWFVALLDWATRQILHLIGLKTGGEHSIMYTVDELKLIMSESEDSGVLETPEREMLHAIFDFSQLLVRQVMIPRTEFEAIEADASLEDSIKIATHSSFTKFPVYDDDLDHIIGILHSKDLIRAGIDPEHADAKVRDLVRDALFVPETISVKQLLDEFRKGRRHLAIVLDEFGGTGGLVTLEDIVEEIFGEVSSPFDTTEPEILLMEDGTYSVSGLALLEDVNEVLSLDLSDPNYDTIAGFVLGQLNRMPNINDTVDFQGCVMKITHLDGRRISRLSIQFEQDESNERVE